MGKRRKSSDSSDSDENDNKTIVKHEFNDSDSSTSDDEDADWNAKGGSKKKVKKARGSKSKKVTVKQEPKIDEEKEEGEVEDDEEDLNNPDYYDDDDELEEFNDGYDDNLMGDEADQERLANMTEKEREQELFNRSEKREVLKTRFEIERKLRLQRKKEQNRNTEASLRSNERRRNMEDKRKVKDALKGFKEQREKKKQKQQKILRAEDIYSSSSDEGEDVKPGVKKSSSSSSSDSDSSSDESEKKSKKHDRRSGSENERDDWQEEDEDLEKDENYVITLQDLNSIRISRNKFEKWCYAPFFKETVLGAFVRIGIGKASNGAPAYRITQVTDVTEAPKVYQFGNSRTNKVVKLKHGGDQRQFRLEFISNSDFTETEFEQWKTRLEKDRIESPSKELIERKRRDIANANNYSFKESDIEAIVKEKERFKESPVNYAFKKTELLKQKEMAEQLNDHDEVDRITHEIEILEEKAKELDRKRTETISAISYINERNRMRNIIEAEKAIMEEREKNQCGEQDDPFRRRKCAPMLVHKFKKPETIIMSTSLLSTASSENGSIKKEVSANSSSISIIDGSLNTSATTTSIKSEKSPGSPVNNDSHNDLFSAHNFDIQIDFDVGISIPNTSSNSSINHFISFSSSSSSSSTKTNRRSLNLEEYKKKKGLI